MKILKASVYFTAISGKILLLIFELIYLFMLAIKYREVIQTDISALANIRAAEWETETYWQWRIPAYLNGELNPQQALPQRIMYVAIHDDIIVGFIAGHLTKRLNCEGELEWINVIPDYRRNGIAEELLQILAKWFISQNAFKICVDPGNEIARSFYTKNGADKLNEHWMFWENINTVLE